MDEAARFIQRKWQWFQTVGKFLAKKRKGKKGGKKKKKKWFCIWTIIKSV